MTSVERTAATPTDVASAPARPPAPPERGSPTARWLRRTAWYLAASAALVVAIVIGSMIGPAGPTWWRVPLAMLERLPLVDIDSGVTDTEWAIVWQIRMPRVILGGLVGGMLAVAGSSYQGVFRNPLVDPYLLGAASGAGLGATIALTVGRSATEAWTFNPVIAIAFVFSVGTVLVTYLVGGAFGRAQSSATLVLAGVAVVTFTTAIQTFLLQRNVDTVREVYSWILGRLSTATWSDVRLVLPYVSISVIVLMLHRRHLDLMRVGDDEATTLGMNVRRTRLLIIVAATLGTAAVVAVSGLIGFVGLIIPHMIRLVAGAGYRRLIPLSVLVGGAFLILADIPGRVLSSPAETPIGVVTAFLGAPFFILLLRMRRVVT